MSFAQPVICSDIEYFKIFINKNNVGYLQNKSLKKNIRELNINEYYKLQKNCLDFLQKKIILTIFCQNIKIFINTYK